MSSQSLFDNLLLGSNGALVVLLVIATLPSDAPVKRQLATSLYADSLRTYLGTLQPVMFLVLVYNCVTFAWLNFIGFDTVKTSWRLQWSFSFLVLSAPCRYMLNALTDPSRLFEFEEHITGNHIREWTTPSVEVLALLRMWYKWFVRVKAHRIENVPSDGPALIVANHALGHYFDMPMMICLLRKHRRVYPRILVSPAHFNIPVWSSLIYRLGGVPRTRANAEILMQERNTIVVYGARREDGGMVWNSSRAMFLDLASKYNYVVIPAMCVSNEDVLEIVYKLPSEDQTTFRSLKTLSQPIRRRRHRAQYRLHFSEPIPIPEPPRGRNRAQSTAPGVQSAGHRRHWSKEIEIRIRNAVDDAMTDGIIEMYEEIKGTPDPMLMRSVTRKMRALSQDFNQIDQVMQDELRRSVMDLGVNQGDERDDERATDGTGRRASVEREFQE